MVSSIKLEAIYVNPLPEGKEVWEIAERHCEQAGGEKEGWRDRSARTSPADEGPFFPSDDI